MKNASALPLSSEWKKKLGLINYHSPELYESANEASDVSYALAIRTLLDELGLSAVFCVQGVPTVVILEVEQYDSTRIMNLHGELWNQGLASLLLVIAGDTLRAFSLARKPYVASIDFDKRCLINVLNLTADALQIRNLIYGAESGRLWKDYAEYFQPKERIDQVLLDNLQASHRLLYQLNLSSDAAQALLMQTMFIAYLEDRRIITADYFLAVSNNGNDSFSSLLETGNTSLLESLFRSLRQDFNGDLFVAPCSFEPNKDTPVLESAHLEILARFRPGWEEMNKGGQQRLWGYNFRFIPVELISAVYDRFLGEKEEERREQGAYYTPLFLADTVVLQVWDMIPTEIREKGQFLDPACGSGVFLVRLFQRLCEHWRSTRSMKTIPWNSLLTILQKIHGWDFNESAVRVAIFSLYVALLEEVSPPDIRRLISRGRILPELWGKTLVYNDFFETPHDNEKFHVIIGNPPWTSRRGNNRLSISWCNENQLPMPAYEEAWAFAWKAKYHLTNDGLIAFLLPAMGFLHNQAQNTITARNTFIRENRIHRIINLADLRFQLFEHANRPAALIIYGKNDSVQIPYRFDYWAPKADLNLKVKRFITLSSADKHSLNSTTAINSPLAFKQRLWMREPDHKLFAYLSKFTKLGDSILEYKNQSGREKDINGLWVIGEGFQPYNDDGNHKPTKYSKSEYVGVLSNLPIDKFQRLAQPVSELAQWRSRNVRRKGFEAGFIGPKILIPRGFVTTPQWRLRAAYTEDDLTFQDIIQAITIPPAEKSKGKLLTALLNSKVAIWYAFHGTASFGADRPEVKQAELLRLPFPNIKDLPEPNQAATAAKKLIKIIDTAKEYADHFEPLYQAEFASEKILSEIDQLAYQYFCLSDDEILLIEDTVEKIIPGVQPHKGSFPDLWKPPTENERRAYATTLTRSLKDWFRNEVISVRLEASNHDLGILCLSLESTSESYTEARDASLADVLMRISEYIHQPLQGNFQLMPNLRIFAGKNLYLIKPLQMRFWLRSAALADADGIAMDLQDAATLGRRGSPS